VVSQHPATTPHAPFVLGHTCTVRHTHSKRSVCMSNPPRPVPSAVLCELQHGHFIAEVLVVAASVPQAKKEPEARSLRLYGDSLVLVRLLALIVLCVRPVRKGTLDAGPSECIGIRAGRQDDLGCCPPPEAMAAFLRPPRRIHGPPFWRSPLISKKRPEAFSLRLEAPWLSFFYGPHCPGVRPSRATGLW
jgi:hypothetical protein